MDSVVEKLFYDYLVSLGFPSSAIVYEPAFRPAADGRRFRPDFAVLDPKTNDLVAIVELKGSEQNLPEALRQVRWYTAQLQDPSVRSYVAIPSSAGGFSFFQADENGGPKLVHPTFIGATALTSATTAEKKENLEHKKKRTIDRFFVVCYCAATCAVLIAAADLILKQYGITVLTAERLALLAAAAGLLIIPFLQKFKALGVEIERHIIKPDG